MRVKDIAEKFNISPSTLYRFKKGKNVRKNLNRSAYAYQTKMKSMQRLSWSYRTSGKEKLFLPVNREFFIKKLKELWNRRNLLFRSWDNQLKVIYFEGYFKQGKEKLFDIVIFPALKDFNVLVYYLDERLAKYQEKSYEMYVETVKLSVVLKAYDYKRF